MPSGTDVTSTRTSLAQLSLLFVAWKALIFLITCASPGIGYDTSTDLLLHADGVQSGFNDTPPKIHHVVLKFVRWDAIYFTEAARQGLVFEQQWAFGKGLSTVLTFTANALGMGRDRGTLSLASAGLLVSHVSHWLSVLLLYAIAGMLQDPTKPRSSTVPFVAAILHIVSPAGVFLSAPYTESLFSFLNMLGFCLYVRSLRGSANETTGLSLIIKFISGVSFGCATMIRSNGVLSGIPFFIDAIEATGQLLSPRTDNFEKSTLLLQLQFTILAGSCIAIGWAFPQFLAYQEYCIEGPAERPWCKALVPSIFTFVQSHYWNVGFLRYWTLSNLPLFLLASPVLYLTILSGWQEVLPAVTQSASSTQRLRLRIALPQLVLSSLALTNYHVQVITRLSSGYPLWYIWLASKLMDSKHSSSIVHVLVVYGLVQAALFASFLPPA